MLDPVQPLEYETGLFRDGSGIMNHESRVSGIMTRNDTVTDESSTNYMHELITSDPGNVQNRFYKKSWIIEVKTEKWRIQWPYLY